MNRKGRLSVVRPDDSDRDLSSFPERRSMTIDARGNPHEVARQGDFLVSTDPAQLDVPLIHEFLSNRSYWAAGIPLEVVRKSIENALCFGLYHKGRQIGFARMVTDRATFAYLGDVFVVESCAVRGSRNGSSVASWAIPTCRGCVASCSARATRTVSTISSASRPLRVPSGSWRSFARRFTRKKGMDREPFVVRPRPSLEGRGWKEL